MLIDKTWTLFLDRDGVINKELPADYVKIWDEFQFEPGALDALKKLNHLFGKIFIVTNQRGVGAGIMTEDDLKNIHQRMMNEIKAAGGRIDKIFYAPDADRSSINRKPYPTMGMKAKAEFPEIKFNKAIMVGNTSSDMQFGRALGMITVYIDEKKKYNGVKNEEMDFIFNSLSDFAKSGIINLRK